jgi:hypothetical protein
VLGLGSSAVSQMQGPAPRMRRWMLSLFVCVTAASVALKTRWMLSLTHLACQRSSQTYFKIFLDIVHHAGCRGR